MADETIRTVEIRFEVDDPDLQKDLARAAARWVESVVDDHPDVSIRHNVGTDCYISGQVGFSDATLFDIAARVRALLAREGA